MKICGEIIKIQGNTAYIKTSRPASCKGCSNAGICNKKELEIQAVNEIGARQGEIVDVEMPEDGKAMILLCYIFLVPVFILLFSVWLYTLQAVLALFAIPLTVIYLLLLRHLNQTHRSINRIISIHGTMQNDEN